MNRAPLASPTSQTLDRLSRASILITGAGGSIGTSLTARLATLHPKSLVLLEASEQALYRLRSHLHQAPIQDSIRANVTSYLGSVNDADLLDDIFSDFAPEYVFHAAAHKHLPMLEEQPLAAIQNNILGTVELIDCAIRHHSIRPSRILLLSTDKAADPTSILGATKRIAEQFVIAHQGVALRLVNVLGSEGSVVATFRDQISQGQPLTITDPDAERFFITSEEAADLLISAAVQAPDSSLLAPSITSTHKVVELANFLASEHRSYKSVEIEYSSLRDGEKLVETLYASEERPGIIDTTGCISIYQANQPDLQSLDTLLQSLRAAVRERDTRSAIGLVRHLVPNYKPSPTVLEAAHRSSKATHS